MHPSVESSLQASSIEQAFLKRAAHTYKWPSDIQMNNQTGMSVGDIGDRLDQGIQYRYSGANWIPNSAGMVPIVPTGLSGTGVSMGGGGNILAVNSPNWIANGVFTSDFDWYRITGFMQFTAAMTAGINFNFTSGGVSDTANSYFRTSLHSSGATVTANVAQSTTVPLSVQAGAIHAMFSLDLYNPAKTGFTWGSFDTYFAANPPSTTSANGVSRGGLKFHGSTKFDGFRIGTAPAHDCNVRVFGYKF